VSHLSDLTRLTHLTQLIPAPDPGELGEKGVDQRVGPVTAHRGPT